MLTVLFLCLPVAWAEGPAPVPQRELLVYCGTTMVRPITEIARMVEKKENIRITISQGGSEDLYQSAKKSRLGDLYFPGEPAYRSKYQHEGLLGEYVTVGYNQLALLVAKGNPRKVRSDVRELLRRDLRVIIGNAESGSVGLAAQKLLEKTGIYRKVVERAVFLATDSRNLSLALKNNEADLALNWRATGFFPDNSKFLDVVDLDTKTAQPTPLLLIMLTFSHQKELTRRFMDFTLSPQGQAIFRSYGFHDSSLRVR
ncbi:MAG: molybdate ABC transporter substrate-binding protein [Desulfuromonadales bacterium]|nr:molybdate ABC transporter substrate-binding protein [Desulfuromonadales bacterium]